MGYLFLTSQARRKFYIEQDENGNITFLEGGKYKINGGSIVVSRSPRNNDGKFDFDAGKAEIIEDAKKHTQVWMDKNEVTAEEVAEFCSRLYAERIEKAKAKAKEEQEREAIRHKACGKLLEKRIAENNGVLVSNYANIYLLLTYLNGQNWGGWELPKMTIGYSCAQYDCDGKQATTIKLDEPIDDEGEMVSKYQVGAPHRHLTKYHRICDWDTLEEIKSLMEEL